MTAPSRPRKILSAAWPPLAAFAVLLVVWQIVARRNKYILPKLQDVAERLWDDPSFFLTNARATLTEAMVGLAFGMTAGVLLAVIMVEVPLLRRALLPLAVVLNVTPVVAIAPALVVAFGFGYTPKIVVTAIITFFPTLINSMAGLAHCDEKTLDVFRTLNATRRETLLKLRLPSAVPFFLAAARVAFPLSLIGAVVGEFVAPGSAKGLGNVITVASANSDLSLVYASIFCLALFGVALTAGVTVLERSILRRMGSTRR